MLYRQSGPGWSISGLQSKQASKEKKKKKRRAKEWITEVRLMALTVLER